jgi:hypothetical protein
VSGSPTGGRRDGRTARRGYDRIVIPLVLLAAGAVALAGGLLALRRIGPGVRIGRILAATRVIPVADAVRLAGEARPHYVGVRGRVDAEDPFEDEHHRPLVYRRARLEAQQDGRWAPFEDSRTAVTFEVSEGLDRLRVDGERLDEGLVVVRRESRGTAGEVPDRVPAGMDASTPVRLTVEQVSAVEHAIVVGVPRLDEAGQPVMGPGLGRPLILTTLEVPEAMRLLAEGRRTTSMIAGGLLAAGVALLVLGIIWGVGEALLPVVMGGLVTPVYAAEPTPGGAGGDPRSPGEGPGFVGDPLAAILVVIGIAAVAVIATLAWIRLTGGPRESHRR